MSGLRWLTQSLGRGIVKAMPKVMKTLSIVGTAAMLWVGGSIIIHSLKDLGWKTPYSLIHDFAVMVAAKVPEGAHGAAEWIATAFADGVFGVALGLAIIPIATRVITPIWSAVFGK